MTCCAVVMGWCAATVAARRVDTEARLLRRWRSEDTADLANEAVRELVSDDESVVANDVSPPAMAGLPTSASPVPSACCSRFWMPGAATWWRLSAHRFHLVLSQGKPVSVTLLMI